jgi:Mycothiol maleylpyruvate isomerase N-terminal domain
MIAKDDATRELERHWAELRSVIESVPDEEIAQPGVVEEWSLKDIVGHIAFWADRGAATLRASNAGSFEGLVWGEGATWVDDWNERESQARKDRPYVEIRGEWLKAHEAARQALEAATDDTLNAPFRGHTVADFYIGDTYTHYEEHAEQIKTWLHEMETTEK